MRNSEVVLELVNSVSVSIEPTLGQGRGKCDRLARFELQFATAVLFNRHPHNQHHPSFFAQLICEVKRANREDLI